METPQTPGAQSQLVCALKLFFPSWNFFDDFTIVPRLECRIVAEDKDSSNWQPVHKTETTNSLWRVLFNSSGNAELLERSLVQRAADAPQLDAESQAMLIRMARGRAGELERQSACSSVSMFQCRIFQGGQNDSGEVVWLSEPQPLSLSR